MLKFKDFFIIVSILGLFGFLAEPAKAQEKPHLEDYKPIGTGICSDVKLPCAVMVLKETDFFYAVFDQSGTKIVALTKVTPDGKEETVWGKLPPKPEQPSRQPKPEQEGTDI